MVLQDIFHRIWSLYKKKNDFYERWNGIEGAKEIKELIAKFRKESPKRICPDIGVGMLWM